MLSSLMFIGLVAGLSLSAFGNGRGPDYLPNDGTAQPGNPGTGLRSSGPVSAMPANKKSVSDANQLAPEQTDTLQRSNTSVNPVPEDTDDLTLRGKSKQSQEEREVDFSTAPDTDHSQREKTRKP